MQNGVAVPQYLYHDTFCTASRTFMFISIVKYRRFPSRVSEILNRKFLHFIHLSWVQLHGGFKFSFWLTWRIAEFFTWINKCTNFVLEVKMKLSQYDDRRAVGPIKINCLIKQVPEHYIWVFLNPPLVYRAFLCHSYILFRGLKINDLGWQPRLTHYADNRELCWRHSPSAGQGLLQKFSLE